ncbi:MAG: hypothetical protein ACTTI6_03120 [Treponema sp.]|uniref:hypothetical protein n=1 Tax=Treponema sp. TaxID=166 RepID=UPI003FA20326
MTENERKILKTLGKKILDYSERMAEKYIAESKGMWGEHRNAVRIGVLYAVLEKDLFEYFEHPLLDAPEETIGA